MSIQIHRTHPNLFELDWRSPGDPGHSVLASILDFHQAGGDATLLASVHENGKGLDGVRDIKRELGDDVPTTINEGIALMIEEVGLTDGERIDATIVDEIMDPNWYEAASISAAGPDHTLNFALYGGANLTATLYLQALKSADGTHSDFRDGLSLTYTLKELPATVHKAAALCERMFDELLPRFATGERGDIDERATVL